MNSPEPFSPKFDIVVQIGAFQPWLQVHQAALELALQQSRQVLLLWVDADRARSAVHPFTATECRQILGLALPETLRHRVHVMGLRQNLHPGREWANVWQHARQLSGSTEPRLAVLQAPDAPRRYWPNVPRLPYPADDDPGLTWRQAAFGSTDPTHVLRQYGDRLVPATRAWFEAWLQGPLRQAVHAEWQLLQHERAAWAAAPYPPTLVTVDCVVQCADHVLLIQRGRQPGQGLHALPGGFLDVHETLVQSACRELCEETGLALPATLQPSGQAVFDAPGRSQRGRVITHAYHFVLPDANLPVVQAGDDAAQAHWVPLAQLPLLSGQLHDDHALILDHFLHVMPTDIVMPLTPA